MYPRTRTQGFTLMEALIVVAVISISAGIAAPALSRAMANRRANEATHSLVRIGARARSEALVYGRAHLLRYADATDGRVELWRGRLDRCSANDWATIVSADCNADPDCLDAVDMTSFASTSHSVRMRLPGASAADLCFEPSGESYVSTTGLFGTTPPSGTDGVLFTLQRLESGADAGPLRRVVFPFAGTPRIAR